jgi:hypothetical protein
LKYLFNLTPIWKQDDLVFGSGLKVSIPPQGGPFAKQARRFGCLTTKLIG